MKSIIFFILLALAPASLVSAQPADVNTPPQRAPKLPASTAGPATLPSPLRSARAAGDTNLLVTNLVGIILVTNSTEVRRTGAELMAGVEVRGIPWLNRDEFKSLLARFLGRPLDFGGVKDMQEDIILYCREKNRPLVDVILLPQVVDNGVIQLWFLEGRVGDVSIENPDKKWFSSASIRHQIRLSRLDSVDSEKLIDDLDWLNRNPFREVRASFKQGRELGESDVVVNVNDRLPWRPYFGYEDSGTKYTGEDRLLFGVNWGNAFGLEHQLNYQYTTDLDFDLLHAHSASYLVPLPWRHLLTVFGSYVTADTDLSSVSSAANSSGVSWQVGLRYGVPLPRLGPYQHEVSAGFDFKRSNNDFEFGGLTTSSSSADIAQFVAAYTGALPDRWGQTSVGLEGYASPGGLVGNNDDADFQQLRSGAKSDYFYARASGERLTRLPWDCSWDLRGTLQLATTRLLPSEEFGIGGYRTVRGYSERLANGDDGWNIVNELRSPAWRLSNLLGRHGSGDYLQLLAFLDYGGTNVRSAGPDDPPDARLTSVGLGLRYTLSKNLSFRFDYGWQLTDRNLSDEIGENNSRAHIGILASY